MRIRKLSALVASLALIVSVSFGPASAVASHKSQSPHSPKAKPPPKDCEIEVDFLGVCLGD